jgi:ankyrin repeat protein/cytochrome c551/c552
MRGLSLFLLALAASGFAQTSDDLVQLIRANDLATLKSRLAAGGNVNAKDARDTTLLMYAAGYGSVDAVRLLLSSGADVNARNQMGNTALLYGAGNLEKVRLLVDNKADVNAKTKNGRTALMAAATSPGNSATVKLLLDKGADAKPQGDRGLTALQAAADTGDFETIRLLIAAGADAKGLSAAGNTALQSVSMNCDLEAIKFLLAKGADVNVANTASGEVKFGKIQLIGLTPLMLGSTFCSPQLVKTLLDAGAKVNATDIRGMTPLMFAVSSEEQNPAVVNLLIKAGADVNVKSKAGETALDGAMKFGSRPVIAVLNAAGAKPGLPYTAPERKAAPRRETLAAVETGSAALQHGATEFFKQSGCVGCHHQPAVTTALSSARKAGAKVNEQEAASYIKMMEGMTMNFQQLLIERLDSGGSFDPWISILTALDSTRYPSNSLTDLLVTYVANFQRSDGSWQFGGISRAPSEEGSFARTALGLRVLQVYGTPALKTEFAPSIARAREYLLKSHARTNDEAAMQIAGLHWAGGSDDKVHALARTLIAAQRPDGGWSQNPNLASDPYATGETLWALCESGALKTSDPQYQKGVSYLLGTQWEDGSWYVRSRAPKFQPYFQSGFPFDHDQWISSVATSWAVRALAPAVETRKRASR